MIVILLSLGGFIAAVVVAALLFLIVINLLPDKKIDPARFPFPKGLAPQQVNELASSLLARMTLKEKVAQLSGSGSGRMVGKLALHGHFGKVYAGENKRLAIPPIAFTDGPRGITTAVATCFPAAIARAASWDVGLQARVGDAMGKEARAANANYYGGVALNLINHPSGGRSQEYYGEDSFLIGEMAVPFLQAVQRHNVMACIKHYALNNMENNRFVVDVQADERTLREVYLPHFKRCVEAGAASVMSAYNRFRGEYCGHNAYLLTTLLRQEWGFKGFVSSDFGFGLRDGAKGVKAGMDVEMPAGRYYGKNLFKLLQAGAVTEAEIDAMALRVLETKLAFVTRADSMAYPRKLLACPEHRALAREAAEKGLVLLRNEGKLLPLDKGKIKSVCLTGPLAKSANTGDRGSSRVRSPYVISPYQGLADYLGSAVSVRYATPEKPEEVEEAAERSDVAIVVAGMEWRDEGEYVEFRGRKRTKEGEKEKSFALPGGDRYPLGLKKSDVELIERTAAANPNTIVVIVAGSAVTMEEWKDKVPAILFAFYSGMEGGAALARILFGAVSPSGKLPLTIPRSEADLPAFDSYAVTAKYGYYHGYTLFDKRNAAAGGAAAQVLPAFPFGFGLSYARFEYRNLLIENAVLGKNDTLRCSVDIANAGSSPAEEIVQLYAGYSRSRIDRPVKTLKAFRRVPIAPGETKTVALELKIADLAYYDTELRQWEVERMAYELFVGPSSNAGACLKGEFRVE